MSTDNIHGFDRRQFITLGIGAFVVSTIPMIRRRELLVRRTLPVMGTIAEVIVVDHDQRRAHAAIDAAMNTLRDVERSMTRFTSTSDIGRANASAGRQPTQIAPTTALVVRKALVWANATDGDFDPAIGSAVALWDVTRRHEPPGSHAIKRLARRDLHRAVEVGSFRGNDVLRFHDADVQLDLGAIAKGYGVDRAATSLRDHGIGNAMVNVGGDLYAMGHSPSGDAWMVGIQDPADDRALIGSVHLSDAAVATSGTYLQFFRHRGTQYHHLLDPDTAAPRVTTVRSFTVRAATCMDADAASTALFGMEAKRAARVLAQRAPGAEIVQIA